MKCLLPTTSGQRSRASARGTRSVLRMQNTTRPFLRVVYRRVVIHVSPALVSSSFSMRTLQVSEKTTRNDADPRRTGTKWTAHFPHTLSFQVQGVPSKGCAGSLSQAALSLTVPLPVATQVSQSSQQRLNVSALTPGSAVWLVHLLQSNVGRQSNPPQATPPAGSNPLHAVLFPTTHSPGSVGGRHLQRSGWA